MGKNWRRSITHIMAWVEVEWKDSTTLIFFQSKTKKMFCLYLFEVCPKQDASKIGSLKANFNYIIVTRRFHAVCVTSFVWHIYELVPYFILEFICMHFYKKVILLSVLPKIMWMLLKIFLWRNFEETLFNIACITLKEVKVQNFHSALSRAVVLFVINWNKVSIKNIGIFLFLNFHGW